MDINEEPAGGEPAGGNNRGTGASKHDKNNPSGERSKTPNSGLQEFFDLAKKGGGMFTSEIVRQETALLDLMINQRTEVLHAIAQWGGQVKQGMRPLCLSCDHEFTARDSYPSAFVLSRTMFRSGEVLLMAVCRRCSKQTDDALLEVAFQNFKRMGMARDKLEMSP